MARSIGKQFEDNFRKSVPDYALSYRPPDSAQGFDVGASNNSLATEPDDKSSTHTADSGRTHGGSGKGF